MLGSQPDPLPFMVSDLVYISGGQTTIADPNPCGNIIIEFFNNDTAFSELDATLFDFGNSNTEGFFQVLPTTDVNKVGQYPILYRAYYEHYKEFGNHA